MSSDETLATRQMTKTHSPFVFGLMLVLTVGAATVPRLVISYGMDGDGIRGMLAARNLIEQCRYSPSRLPGNPLFEYLLGLLSLIDGYIVTNSVVLAFFAAAIAAFWLLIRDLENRWLLIGLFSLTPILLVNAVTTMDYLPGLAMILWCYVCARSERIVLAHVLLGLSMGFRLSNALFVVPLSLFLLCRGKKKATILGLAVFGVLLGLSFYLPILMRFGWRMFTFPAESYHGLAFLFFLGYKSVMLFGPVATVGLALLLCANIGTVISVTRRELHRPSPEYATELATVVLFTALFVVHPDESEYLIPVVPFLYLLLCRWFDRKRLLIVSALVLSFALFSVELRGGESGRRTLSLRPSWGIVVQDFLDRKELEALRDGVSRFAGADKAVIMTGYGPVLGFENRKLVKSDAKEISSLLSETGISDVSSIYRLPERQVYFVSGLSKENLTVLRREGYTLYTFSESAPSLSLHYYGYDPYSMGIKRLEIKGPKAFYRFLTTGPQ